MSKQRTGPHPPTPSPILGERVSHSDGGEGFKPTDLGDLPAGWEVVRLGDVCEKPQYGYTASASETPGGPKFLRITDIQDGFVNWSTVPYCEIDDGQFEKYELWPDDIVIARIGATTGKSYRIVQCPPAMFASYLIRIRPKSQIRADFLTHFAQSDTYWKQINASKGGRLKQGVNIPILKSLLLPLPPLDEQRKIAHVLNTVQQAIAAQDDLIAAAQEVKRSLMWRLFTYGPGPEPALTKETEIGEVPEHWEVVELRKVAQVRYGLGQPPQKDENGVPMIRATNIKRGRITHQDLLRIHPDAIPKNRNPFLKSGEIIVVRSGAYTGDVAMITPEWEDSIAGYDLVVSPSDKLSSVFCSQYLLGSRAQNYFKGQSARSAQPHINSRELGATQIPFPSLAEQHQIAHILQTADAKIAAEQDRRAALQELFNSLLQELMTGKLRVKDINLKLDNLSR